MEKEPVTKKYCYSIVRLLFLVSLFGLSTVSIAQASPKVVKAIYAGDTVRIGSTIRLEVENLSVLTGQNKTIFPYLDGLSLDGAKVRFPSKDIVEFNLVRAEKSKSTWDEIILRRSMALSTVVSLSIGVAGENPIATDVNIEIELVEKRNLIGFGLVLFGIVVSFLFCAMRSNIVRDTGREPDYPDARKPFSISRVQMAIWFILIIGAYPFIYLITGELGSINGSLLGLMGISAGTALGAVVIDNSKNGANILEKNRLESERGVLIERVTHIGGLPNSAVDVPIMTELSLKKIRISEIEKSLHDLPDPKTIKMSKGFFTDILSDASGVSFHRFQIFAWTIVLAFIFILEVLAYLQMPEFSTTLLGLMGVSSGTYIGFKFPEQPKV
jgi:uncharacterized membrane protein